MRKIGKGDPPSWAITSLGGNKCPIGTRREQEPPFLEAWVADVAPPPRRGSPDSGASLGSRVV